MPKRDQIQTPPNLSDDAKRIFAGVLEEYDLDIHQIETLALACEARDRAALAETEIAEHGLLLVGRWNQLVPNPAVKIKEQAEALWARLVRELRLDDSLAEPARLPRSGRRS